MARPPARRRGDQLDLLDWQPPQPVERFDDLSVRAATIAAKVARCVSVALKDTSLSRDEVARQMSEGLGQPVSKHMLDAYASEAREEHVINLVRFIALLDATRDRRLLQMIAEMFGWAVIERRYLALIELASIREREDELKRQGAAIRRQARSGGLI